MPLPWAITQRDLFQILHVFGMVNHFVRKRQLRSWNEFWREICILDIETHLCSPMDQIEFPWGLVCKILMHTNFGARHWCWKREFDTLIIHWFSENRGFECGPEYTQNPHELTEQVHRANWCDNLPKRYQWVGTTVLFFDQFAVLLPVLPVVTSL